MSIDKQRMNVGSAATLYTDIEIYRQIRDMTYTYIAYREAVGPIIGRQRAPHPHSPLGVMSHCGTQRGHKGWRGHEVARHLTPRGLVGVSFRIT